MPFYVGVDIGGTNIKAGVVDENGTLIRDVSRSTGADRPQDEVLPDILLAVEDALKAAGLALSDISGVGVGCPGMIDPERGFVVYNNNLGWRNFPLVALIRDALNLPVMLGNDANVAALGEFCAGCAKGASSAVIITLGTGVGSGFVQNGRIWTGWNSAAAEFGHMVIVHGGRLCTCGRKGCFEAYASATGLIALTNEAINSNPESLMVSIAKASGHADGKTAFDAAQAGDETAKRVIDDYISYLACGLTNLINGLQPEVMGIGGGLGKQGEKLLVPLREKVYSEVYGGKGTRFTSIVSCTLGYQAGIIGAAMQHCAGV